MKQFVCVVLALVLCACNVSARHLLDNSPTTITATSTSATSAEQSGDRIFDIGNLLQSTVSTDASGNPTRTCQTRRGFADCTPLGPDCFEKLTVQGTQRSFPMKDWAISFPCGDGFPKPPMVFTSILGAKNSKMYSASVHAVTSTGFRAYVQRTDDVPSDGTAESCDNIRICYVALVM
eukprot:c6274_g1_i1.p1 GENE.c6274_g1_i1~~c6274_g1_i1.p1  ORF type:complete len:193 (-),score=51.14 c6274_g1_i1:136-669(-)